MGNGNNQFFGDGMKVGSVAHGLKAHGCGLVRASSGPLTASLPRIAVSLPRPVGSAKWFVSRRTPQEHASPHFGVRNAAAAEAEAAAAAAASEVSSEVIALARDKMNCMIGDECR